MSRSAEPRKRVGGRSARVLRDVLEATLTELACHGFAALTFEAVAARARVSRMTIYRRWASKQELVQSALLRTAEIQLTDCDTGSLRRDLLEKVRLCASESGRAEQNRYAALLGALMSELANPELRALGRLVESKFNEPMVSAIQRGIARGELPVGTDPQLIISPIFTTIAFWTLVQRQELDLAFAEQLIDVVLAGAASGAAVRAGARRRVSSSRERGAKTECP